MGRNGGNGATARRSSARGGSTLGPVDSLERHLPREWWRTIFNALYLKTDGDVVENVDNTTREVDLLVHAAHLDPVHAILDLCCGQGRHALELARRGFVCVVGVDQSKSLLRVARRRARAAHLAVPFRLGDARRLRLPEASFDSVVLFGNSFGYFDSEDDDARVLAGAQRVLREGGALALDLADGDWIRTRFEPRSWEWIDARTLVCRERALSADGRRLVCREIVVDARRGVLADQFYAQRLYGRADLHALLERAGYVAIEDHGGVRTGSERAEDLGLMEERFFLTARTRGRVAPAATRTRARRREVMVLLGDPTIADPVKRGGRWNPEDHDTVARLKTALAELDDHAFVYHDRHADLIETLATAPPRLVLNFCDEGLRNDAALEAHVPALLEALGIPCSGSGPACLALARDKALTRSAAEDLGVPVPLETLVLPAVSEVAAPRPFPLFVKPADADGSLGITRESIVRSRCDLDAQVARLRRELPGRGILVQELLEGPEYSVGLIGNPERGDLEVLPVLEVDYDRLDPSLPRMLPYESKWHPESPYWKDVGHREARLGADQLERLRRDARLLYERLGCRDYARLDFRAGSDGAIRFLEANPNPAWCWDGKLALMGKLAGFDYPRLLRRILDAVERRLHM